MNPLEDFLRMNTIQEAEEGEEDDSFEIYKEVNKKKKLETYSSQLDEIEQKVEAHNSQ